MTPPAWKLTLTAQPAARSALPDSPVGRLAGELARDLKLPPVTDPFLAKCLLHFVGNLHPVSGTGGILLFDMLATVCRAVLAVSVAKYGQVNAEDEPVICGGSPMRLIRYYRTLMPSQRCHPNATLEGGQGKNGDEHDAWFIARSDEFERHHLLTRRFLTDAAVTTLAVVRAIPARLLAGLTENDLRAVADEIAAGLTAQGYPVNLLTHSELRFLSPGTP